MRYSKSLYLQNINVDLILTGLQCLWIRHKCRPTLGTFCCNESHILFYMKAHPVLCNKNQLGYRCLDGKPGVVKKTLKGIVSYSNNIFWDEESGTLTHPGLWCLLHPWAKSLELKFWLYLYVIFIVVVAYGRLWLTWYTASPFHWGCL